MEYVLLASVGGLFVGVLLGIFLMALICAADRDRLPDPLPERTHLLNGSWPDLPAASFAGVEANRGGGAVVRLTEAAHESANTGARHSASSSASGLRASPAG